MYTAILICVITLIETWVVYELYNAREYAKKINENNKSKEEGVTSLTPSPFLCYTHFC